MKNNPFRVNLSILILSVFCIVVFLGNLAPAESSSSDKGCQVSITSDQYVAPAAELASTKDNPDFITLENSVLKVTSLPNRGRLIFDYYYKPADVSLVHNETSPMPLEMDDSLFLEFGGYYTSYPWNQRANQPYDLEYEVREDSSTGCSVVIFKSGDDFALDFASELKIKPEVPKVYMEIELSNHTEKEQEIDWNDSLVISGGEDMGTGAELVLPGGTDKVTINQSTSGWMGEKGEELSWPQPWKKWENFENQGKFSVDLEKVDGTSIKAYYPEQDLEFVKEWSSDDIFKELQVLSWGPSYDETLGAYQGFLVSNSKPNLTIKPGESKTFQVTLFVSENR